MYTRRQNAESTTPSKKEILNLFPADVGDALNCFLDEKHQLCFVNYYSGFNRAPHELYFLSGTSDGTRRDKSKTQRQPETCT